MGKIATVKITDPNDSDDYIVINEEDFDESTMHKWEGADEDEVEDDDDDLLDDLDEDEDDGKKKGKKGKK